MALTTLDEVKVHLGIALTDTSRDAQLTALIAQASSVIASYLKQDVEEAEYTEYYEGTGRQVLPLRHRPVSDVSSVRVDTVGYYGVPAASFGADTELVAGTDYVLMADQPDGVSRRGWLARIGAVWPRPNLDAPDVLTNEPGLSLGNVLVTYTAGYAVIPPAITLACNMLVASLARSASAGGPIDSESFDYYSYNMADAASVKNALDSVTGVLAGFRQFVI